jgi:hypothetical protein
MRDAARRDHSLEPLRELTSQALRGAIRQCGRGGTALAAQESSQVELCRIDPIKPTL